MFYSFNRFFRSIAEINRRYRKPSIHMTPMVKFAMLVLRVYLLLLVILLVYRFIILVRAQ